MTNYYQCATCAKTMSQNDTIPKFEAVGVTHLCNKCLNPTEFAFSACTADQPEPSIGFCDGCDELEAELHLMDGDWLCDTCKATGVKVQMVGPIHVEPDTKLLREELQDLKKDCADHWEMIKARVFITLFLVWVCFAIWSKYVS